MIIHPEGERRSAESRTPKVVAKLTDVLKLAVEDVDERLETVDGTEHDERGRGHGLALGSDEIDELWGASQSGVVEVRMSWGTHVANVADTTKEM